MAELVNRKEYIVESCKGREVLDIGCVAADRLMDLHSRIKTVAKTCTGLDINPHPEVIQADAQNFELENKYEIIVASEVIEHLADLKGFLESIERHLCVGGKVLITTPNAYSLVHLKDACRGKVVENDDYHVILFDKTTLLNLLRNFGPPNLKWSFRYYREDDAKGKIYRMNNFFSRFVKTWAPGIMITGEKVQDLSEVGKPR